MKPIHHVARSLLIPVICILYVVTLASVVYGQNAPLRMADKNSVPSLVQQMVGTWNVQQRMWPGSGTEAINLPSAVARRRLVGDAFLEEVMEPSPGSQKESFTRIAYFNYNAVNQQYEYFSIDTRASQMMNEKSYEADIQGRLHDQGEIVLYGDSFVAPRWGKTTNAAFRYRLVIGKVEKDCQLVRLYLTPQLGETAKEFLAFEYVYTLRR